MSTWVSGLGTPCHRQFGYAMAADALANFDASQLDAAPFGAHARHHVLVGVLMRVVVLCRPCKSGCASARLVCCAASARVYAVGRPSERHCYVVQCMRVY